MRFRSMLVLLLGGTLLNACNSGGTDDALVGAWIRMRTPTEMRDRYVFGADGAFAFDENKPGAPETEDHMTGTYTAANGVVTATVSNTLTPDHARVTFSYYANATQFSSAALRAATAHEGIVGRWTGIRKLEILGDSGPASGAAVDVEFRADATYRWTVTPFDGTAAATDEGSWAKQADGTFHTTGGTSTYTLDLLDNEALVDAPYLWQRN